SVDTDDFDALFPFAQIHNHRLASLVAADLGRIVRIGRGPLKLAGDVFTSFIRQRRLRLTPVIETRPGNFIATRAGESVFDAEILEYKLAAAHGKSVERQHSGEIGSADL